MNEMQIQKLIKIDYQSDRPTVSARELHEFLEIETRYNDWFPRMCEYGFAEGVDFNLLKNEQVRQEGNRMVSRVLDDAQLTIDMAKELCMIQRTDKGRQARQYFIQLEKDWNSPEKVMARALMIAKNKLEEVTAKNKLLNETIQSQNQLITEMKPKASYYDMVLKTKNAVPVTQIAKDYGMSAVKLNRLLHEMKIQYKSGKCWVLYQDHANKGYTKSSTYVVDEDKSVIHTYWTQSGRLFLYNLLKEKCGILPVMEKESA